MPHRRLIFFFFFFYRRRRHSITSGCAALDDIDCLAFVPCSAVVVTQEAATTKETGWRDELGLKRSTRESDWNVGLMAIRCEFLELHGRRRRRR